jgi:hypothetical protein
MNLTPFEPTPRETLQARRASLAVGVAPPTVLLALLAVVAGLIEPDTGLLLFVAGIAWTAYEMYRYLKLVDTAAMPGDEPEDRYDVR